jgi:acetyltransferase-like isoleucine patch superfamily enzyme
VIKILCFFIRFFQYPIKLILKTIIIRKLCSVGKNFVFDPYSSIYSPELIEIGDNVFIGERAHISAKIKFRNNIMLGPRPVIIGGNHYFAVKGRSIRSLRPKASENYESISIEDEVWCGASVVILGGVVLGMGCIIGAGSVVTKNIPPYVMAVGNYCRPIAKIFDDETLLEHLTILGFDKNFAYALVKRRNEELKSFGIIEIKQIDKTDDYWEFMDN